MLTPANLGCLKPAGEPTTSFIGLSGSLLAPAPVRQHLILYEARIAHLCLIGLFSQLCTRRILIATAE